MLFHPSRLGIHYLGMPWPQKKRTKTSPEQWAKWEENERRIEEIIQRRLKEDAARAQSQRQEPASRAG